jgi:hypothetical protein
MLTNKDIDDCIVMAELDAADRIESALEEFYRPDVEMEAATLWATMEEPLKKLVRMRAPEAAKRMDEIVKGGR